MKKKMITLWLVAGALAAGAGEIITYPVPRELLYTRHNDDFTVCARTPGGEWQDLYEFAVMVDLDDPRAATLVQFDASGRVEVRVRVNNRLIGEARVRPLARGIVPEVRGNYLYFAVESPGKFSVEVNGDRTRNLHLIVNAPEGERPDSTDASVMYFGPGVHRPADQPGGAFHVSSGTTVYLAPGAVVQGKFVCENVSGVTFRGRGYVDSAERGFELRHCRDVEIEGITVVNPSHYAVYGGEVDGLRIRNLKVISCARWGDGIDLMSCSRVEIRDVFVRTSDDCIAIYGSRWAFRGDARDYTVSEAVLWADVAHPVHVGLHGDGDTIERLRFSDLDILQHDEDDREYQGCLAISAGDGNTVCDVLFERVRVEEIEEGQLFRFRVVFNEKYSRAPGAGVKGVTVRDFSYAGEGAHPSLIAGHDEGRGVEGVHFERVAINGRRVGNAGEAGVQVGKFARDVTFKR